MASLVDQLDHLARLVPPDRPDAELGRLPRFATEYSSEDVAAYFRALTDTALLGQEAKGAAALDRMERRFERRGGAQLVFLRHARRRGPEEWVAAHAGAVAKRLYPSHDGIESYAGRLSDIAVLAEMVEFRRVLPQGGDPEVNAARKAAVAAGRDPSVSDDEVRRLAAVSESALELVIERRRNSSPEAIAAAEAKLVLSKDPANMELAAEYQRLLDLESAKRRVAGSREHGSVEEKAAWEAWLAALRNPADRDLARKADELDQEWRYTADFRQGLQQGGYSAFIEGLALVEIRSGHSEDGRNWDPVREKLDQLARAGVEDRQLTELVSAYRDRAILGQRRGSISGNRARDLKRTMMKTASDIREAALVHMLPTAVKWGDQRAAMAVLVNLVASRNPGNKAVAAEAAQLRRETGMTLEPQPQWEAQIADQIETEGVRTALTEPVKLFSWDGRNRHQGRRGPKR